MIKPDYPISLSFDPNGGGDGYKVSYDPDTESLIVEKSGKQIEINLNNDIIWVHDLNNRNIYFEF